MRDARNLSAELAGALTGGYLALLGRASSTADGLGDFARHAWGDQTTSLSDAARFVGQECAAVLLATLVGALAAGWAVARGSASSTRPARTWVALAVAVAQLAVGAVVLGQLLRLDATAALDRTTTRTVGRALVGALRSVGGWLVALAWVGVVAQTLVARRFGVALAELGDAGDARRAPAAAERRRRRAEVLQPGA